MTPLPFYVVLAPNGPDCQFVETETVDGQGVGFNHVHSLLGFLQSVAFEELGGSQICH